MMDDARFLRLLGDVLDDQPTRAPARLLDGLLSDVVATPQRHGLGWRLGRSLPRISRFAGGFATGAIVVAIVAIALYQLSPGTPGSGPGGMPTPQASPSPVAPSAPESTSPSPAGSASDAWFVPGPAIAIESTSGELRSGVLYTSDRFQPRITFRLPAFGGKPVANQDTDWCPFAGENSGYTKTSARMFLLAYKPACLSHIMVLRPYAVDCGTSTQHPNAAALTEAILANPTLGAIRLGESLSPANALDRWSLGADPITGLAVTRSSSVAPGVRDPNGCVILPEPGSADPTIEIRADMSAVLYLFDHHGELMVVRESAGGYDGPTGAVAEERGDAGFVELMDRLVTYMADVAIE
jgi:hypothetical protein